MTIKQQGGVFGRNPAFNDVEAETIEVTDISLPDGGEASFGNSNDLKIYHDGGNSYVKENGVGSLLIYGSNMRLGNSDGSKLYLLANSGDKTDIYFDGAVKIRTESTGAKILGNLSFNAGDGIDFSATSGTGTSELFDDYEEGTWTPVISDANSGGNLGSALISNANYTKIGRTVVLSASLSNIDTTGMTSTAVLYIQGLPFTSDAINYAVGNVKVDTVTFPGSRTYIYCQISGGNAYMNFQVGASAVSEDNLDVQHISSGVSDIQFSITYTAA